MTRSLLRVLSLLAVAVAGGGCLTSAVNQLGRRVPSYQRPVRAVILPDDRVIVDFAQFDADSNAAPPEWSFKRVVYGAEAFQGAAAEGALTAPGASRSRRSMPGLAAGPSQ